MVGQRMWTVPAPPSIKLVSMTIGKIFTEMCMAVSPRSYAALTRRKCVSIAQWNSRYSCPYLFWSLYYQQASLKEITTYVRIQCTITCLLRIPHYADKGVVWFIFDSRTWADHVTWGDVYLRLCTERSEVRMTVCVIVFVVYVCCMWGDDEG